MPIKVRYLAYFILIAIIGGCLYLGREVLTPFIFALIFAYLLGPLVTFLSDRLKFPRELAIILVYLILLLVVIIGGSMATRKLITEVRDFTHEINTLRFPDWSLVYAPEIAIALRNSINFSSQQAVKILSGTISSIASLFVFLLALFYFLKEQRKFSAGLERLLPPQYRIEFAIVARKVQQVLGNYLRAQIFLVVFMAAFGIILFYFLGAKYALTMGIIIGLAEIVPIVGPIIAFTLIVAITMVSSNVDVFKIAAVGFSYLLLNQLENILVVPQVTGRMVKLHPLLILISVLIGGHLFGAVGFLLAVPLVASFKVITNHILDLLD